MYWFNFNGHNKIPFPSRETVPFVNCFYSFGVFYILGSQRLYLPGVHVGHKAAPLKLNSLETKLRYVLPIQRWAKWRLSTFVLYPGGGGGCMGCRDKYLTSWPQLAIGKCRCHCPPLFPYNTLYAIVSESVIDSSFYSCNEVYPMQWAEGEGWCGGAEERWSEQPRGLAAYHLPNSLRHPSGLAGYCSTQY